MNGLEPLVYPREDTCNPACISCCTFWMLATPRIQRNSALFKVLLLVILKVTSMVFAPIDSLYQWAVFSRRSNWEGFRTKHPQIFKLLYGGYRLYKGQRWLAYHRIHAKLKDFTLLTRRNYVINLALCDQFRHIQGAVVECGTWKGGMIAGIAALFNDDRDYFLYDSFEGFTFSWRSFLRFFAFNEGIVGHTNFGFGGWPTVSDGLMKRFPNIPASRLLFFGWMQTGISRPWTF